MNRPMRVRPLIALLVAYAAVTWVMTWPYVNYSQFASASYGGDARLIIWTLAWDNHALLTGAPLFQSNLFFPVAESLRYNEHLFGLSLFTLPWAAAGASPVLAYNVTWWLAILLNGLTAFALVQRFAQNRLAAFAGSLAFAFSFYVMLHAHGHLALIWIWPLPASLLLLERWFDAPRAGRLATWLAVLLAQLLTSWYLVIIISLANALMGVVLLCAAPDRPGRSGRTGPTRIGRTRTVHLAMAAVVVAAILYPFARHYAGTQAAPGEAANFGATLTAYLVPPENTLAGRWWEANIDDRPGSIWGEQTLFLGWTALLLAGVGLVQLLRREVVSRRAWVFPALIVVGFLMSLGPSPALLGGSTLAPFAWLTALPGFEGMRVPARFAVLVTLGVAGLAGIGAAAITSPPKGGHYVRLALIPLMLVEWAVVGFPAGKPAPEAIPAIYLTPQVQAARSLVSLPDYSATERWFLDADYLLYSTAHWRPIVNGFGRAAPPQTAGILAQARDFPANAAGLRQVGLQYIVVHAARFDDRAKGLLAAAEASPDYRLAAHVGSDYLFELLAR
jgi:hypothetical protein